MTLPEILFYVFGAVSIATAATLVAAVRSTVAATLSLVGTLLALAGIYVLLGAHLMAAIQVMLHAGAIVVLFLFVVMFHDLRPDAVPTGRQRAFRVGAALVSFLLLYRVLRAMGPLGEAPPAPAGFGGYRQLGISLYTDYVLLVEVAALVLTTAIVGALILVRKRSD